MLPGKNYCRQKKRTVKNRCALFLDIAMGDIDGMSMGGVAKQPGRSKQIRNRQAWGSLPLYFCDRILNYMRMRFSQCVPVYKKPIKKNFVNVFTGAVQEYQYLTEQKIKQKKKSLLGNEFANICRP